MHKQTVSINRMKYTPAKKALIVVLCITSGLLSTQQNSQSHGFYIVDKPQISPPDHHFLRTQGPQGQYIGTYH